MTSIKYVEHATHMDHLNEPYFYFEKTRLSNGQWEVKLIIQDSKDKAFESKVTKFRWTSTHKPHIDGGGE